MTSPVLAYSRGGSGVVSFLAHAALWRIVGRFVDRMSTPEMIAVGVVAVLALLLTRRRGRRRRW